MDTHRPARPLAVDADAVFQGHSPIPLGFFPAVAYVRGRYAARQQRVPWHQGALGAVTPALTVVASALSLYFFLHGWPRLLGALLLLGCPGAVLAILRGFVVGLLGDTDAFPEVPRRHDALWGEPTPFESAAEATSSAAQVSRERAGDIEPPSDA